MVSPCLPDWMASTRPVFWIARFTACSNCCVIVWTSDELLAPVPPPAPNSLATYHSDGRRPGLARRYGIGAVDGAFPSCWRSFHTAVAVAFGGSGSIVKFTAIGARIGTMLDVQCVYVHATIR